MIEDRRIYNSVRGNPGAWLLPVARHDPEFRIEIRMMSVMIVAVLVLAVLGIGLFMFLSERD